MESFPFLRCAVGINKSIDEVNKRHGLKGYYDLCLLYCTAYINDQFGPANYITIHESMIRWGRSGNYGGLSHRLAGLVAAGFLSRAGYGQRKPSGFAVTPAGLRVLADYERRLASFRPDFSGIRGLADVDPA